MNRLHLTAAFAACLLFASLPLAAQTVGGAIRGRVVDPSGGAVADARVTVVDTATGLRRQVVANRAGAYVAASLAAGEYDLTVSAPGFRTIQREQVVLRVGQRLVEDFELTLGEQSSSVTVTAELELVDEASTAIGTAISNNYVVDLPLDGRNFLELALLVAGSTPAAAGSPGTARGRFAFQAAGMREDMNSFVYDGVYAIDPVLNSFTFTPPVDAVREFRIETANSAAGLGRNAGAQVSVELKRGANDLHGTVYEFLRNDALDARNFFDLAERPQPKLRRNQYGFSLGGPIRKNSTFFFGDYEGLRERRAVTRTTNVPTMAERQGDFSSSALPAPFDFLSGRPFANAQLPLLHPVGQAVANLYPTPNLAAAGQNYVGAPNGSDDHNKFDIRVDQRIGGRGQLSGRYSFADRMRFEPYAAASYSSVPGYGNDVEERGQNAMLSETHSFGGRWVNEARLGFNRVDNRTFHQNSGTSVNSQIGLPNFTDRERSLGLSFIQVTGLSSLGGEFNNPQDSTTESYQLSDNLSFASGNHLVQLGFEHRWIAGNAYRDVMARGQISFTDFAYTQSALADLLLGLPTFTAGAMADNEQNQRTWATNFFVQDSWRVRRGLTLNLGLRYEYNQPPFDAFDAAAIYDPAVQTTVQLGTGNVPRGGYLADKNNFAPRVGLAWTPGDSRKTVIRTAYGIHYNFPALAPGLGIYFNPPFFNFQLYFPSQAQIIQIQNPWPQGGAAPFPPSATTYDRNLSNTYAQNWSFGIQRELTHELVASVTYNGTRGVNLLGARDINQPAPSPVSPNLRPNPFFSDINQIESSFDSVYHSLQWQLQCRFRAGLTGLFSYTWSRSIDNASNFFPSSGDANFPQDSRNPGAERSRSSFDAPHRFVGSFAYELPFGREPEGCGGGDCKRLEDQRRRHAAIRPALLGGAAGRARQLQYRTVDLRLRRRRPSQRRRRSAPGRPRPGAVDQPRGLRHARLRHVRQRRPQRRARPAAAQRELLGAQGNRSRRDRETAVSCRVLQLLQSPELREPEHILRHARLRTHSFGARRTRIAVRREAAVLEAVGVKVKRIYEDPSADDGVRILVDRLWPRGVSKVRAKLDAWVRDLAPSTELRKRFHQDGDYAAFERSYREELRGKAEALAELAKQAKESTVTLLYSVASKTQNHALILADIVRRD